MMESYMFNQISFQFIRYIIYSIDFRTMKKEYDSFSPINYRERSDSASSEEGKAEMKIDDKLA
jgi:hypothetical protein